jgi:hypothetical protein
MAFQDTKMATDTLADYMINTDEIFPELEKLYDKIHTDPISKVTLYKRNKFLNRYKRDGNHISITGSQEYYDIYRKPFRDNPLYIRCTGILKNMNFYKDVIVVLCAEDSVSGKSLRYDALHITQSCAIDNKGEIAFDFTLAMNCYSEANIMKLYIWNPYKSKLNGNLSMQIYDVLNN